MGSAYNENIHQLIEFCCELLTLVQHACISEASEGGSVLHTPVSVIVRQRFKALPKNGGKQLLWAN